VFLRCRADASPSTAFGKCFSSCAPRFQPAETACASLLELMRLLSPVVLGSYLCDICCSILGNPFPLPFQVLHAGTGWSLPLLNRLFFCLRRLFRQMSPLFPACPASFSVFFFAMSIFSLYFSPSVPPRLHSALPSCGTCFFFYSRMSRHSSPIGLQDTPTSEHGPTNYFPSPLRARSQRNRMSLQLGSARSGICAALPFPVHPRISTGTLADPASPDFPPFFLHQQRAYALRLRRFL